MGEKGVEEFSSHQHLGRVLEQAVERSDDIVFVTDRNGVFQYVNAAFEKVTGYARDEVIGQSSRILKSGVHDDAFYRQLWQTILSGQPFRAVFINRTRWGGLYHNDQTIIPIRDPAGVITHFVAIGKDVTDRERLERELRRLTAIVAATPDLVATAHPDGRLLYCNPGGRKLLGLGEQEDISGLRVADVHPEWARRIVLEEAIPVALREGIWRGQTAVLARDGHEIPVSQVVIAHKAPDGSVEYLSTIARDITEQQRAEQANRLSLALERALRTVDLALIQERPAQEILEAVCDGAISLGHRMCWVGLKEPDATVRPVVSRGFGPGQLAAVPVRWDDSPLGRCPAGHSIRLGQTVVFQDVDAAPDFSPWLAEARLCGYRSGAVVPLRSDGEVLGILAVYNERPNAFPPEMVRALETLAQQGTLVLITARRRDELRQALQRFHDLAEAIVDGILIADSRGRVTYANPAAERMFGQSEPEMLGQPLRRFLPSAPERAGRWEGRGLRANGESFPVEGSVSRIDAPSGVFHTYVVRDLSERKRFEEQLAYLANHDPLTGLFSRRRFQQELERQLAHARRFGETGALLVMDLDGFKEINDNLGQQAGDQVLAAVAAFLRARVRETDVVARLGGDEFAILLPRAGESEARATAQALLEGLRLLNPEAGGQPVRVTASIGVVVFPRDVTSVDDLLMRADTAVYEAKDAGGDRFAVGGRARSGAASAASRISWERRIRKALATERFELYAQPILDLRNDRVSQYELLLRLVDEAGSPVLPKEFLGVAERTGLIHAIDRWVIRQAIRLMAAHARNGGELRLEVNLSARAFEDPDLLPLVRQELDESGVRPDNLVLEITETATIRDINQARAFVNNLKEVGCRFALDDFGVGFGSFYYLKHLPVDYIKIDGSFIRNLRHDPVDPHIVKAIVEVAAGLGIQTIAEFVEDEGTIRLLRQYRVDYAQGFYIGRPLPVSQLGLGEPGPGGS